MDSVPEPPRPPLRERIMQRLRAAKDIYEGMYIAPYRSTIHFTKREP